MSGLAVFGLKYPSLLQFDQDKNAGLIQSNLSTLYGITRAPSDTHLRERLDTVNPSHLHKPFKQLFAQLQRGKGLEEFDYLDGHYLLSMDGTGYFPSSEVHCDQCRDSRTTTYYQILGTVLVHPDHREVFSLAPEPILKQDGTAKGFAPKSQLRRKIR